MGVGGKPRDGVDGSKERGDGDRTNGWGGMSPPSRDQEESVDKSKTDGRLCVFRCYQKRLDCLPLKCEDVEGKKEHDWAGWTLEDFAIY